MEQRVLEPLRYWYVSGNTRWYHTEEILCYLERLEDLFPAHLGVGDPAVAATRAVLLGVKSVLDQTGDITEWRPLLDAEPRSLKVSPSH